MSDKAKAIFEAKQALNDFLLKNPHMRPMQAEIDKMLKGAGSQHNRMVLLDNMMRDITKELGAELNELKKELEKA